MKMDNENKKIIKQKSDLWTVPNILTYLRFALVVPFVILFLNEKYLESAICIGLSGISDCLDGFFARKLNQVTQLGKLLDPIADKITLISVMFCMAFYAPNVIPILVVLIAKDVAMLIGGVSLLKRKITPPAAEWFGKLATIVFYFAVCIICLLYTSAKHLNAMLVPDKGKVFVDGDDTADEEKTLDIRKKVGLVLQNPDNQLCLLYTSRCV